MKNMRLALKIGIGFGILIVCTVAVSLTALIGMNKLTQGVTNYQRMVQNTSLVSHIQAAMLSAQMTVKDYIITGDPRDIDRYKEVSDTAHKLTQRGLQNIKNPERHKKLEFIGQSNNQYDNALNTLQNLKQRRYDLVKKITETGSRMEASLSNLMERAAKTGATSTASKSGLSIRYLLLGRLYVEKFLENNDQENIAIVDKEFNDFAESLKNLRGSLLRVEWQSVVDNLETDLALYRDIFKDLVATLRNRDEVIHSTVESLGNEVVSTVDEITKSYLEDQEALGNGLNDSSRTARTGLIIATVLGLVFGVGISLVLTRAITFPIRKASDFAAAMSKGDFTGKLQIDNGDEIGIMATSLNNMVVELSSMIRNVVSGVETLTGSAKELTSVSDQLSTAARDTSEKTSGVASAAGEMTSNIQSVSAAMEESSSNISLVAASTDEMTRTVNDIARNAQQAREITNTAVDQSRVTSEKMASLGESANKIGHVTETITEISEQTNLLALNATIEAARAGEAGKGFAVVANEIKELARQTASATVDIKNQIDDMQLTTRSTITDIDKISQIITKINEMIKTIANAVELQSTSTTEIVGNIQQASLGITEVNQNVAHSTMAVADITKEINEINRRSNQVEGSSDQVQQSARALSALSAQLQQLVSHFKLSK